MSAWRGLGPIVGRRVQRIGMVMIGFALATALAGQASSDAADSGARTVTYRGELVDNLYGPVKLTVTTPRHGRPRGSFAIDDLPLGCEDDSSRLISPEPIKFRLTANRQFLADRYVPPSSGGTELYFGVHGRITANGELALGYVFAYENPDDGADEAELECSTQLDAPWRAKRKR